VTVRPFVLHVDLDQFVVAVELLRRPELRGKPVVVGGDGDPTKRGVVSSASYEARAFGVESGVALRTAARRCPDAVFLAVDRDAYEAASKSVMDSLRALGVAVEVTGWDEAFLEVVSHDPEAFSRRVQQEVADGARLSCSVGIGDNKLQAKLASEFAKPGGIARLTSEEWMDVMYHRPTEALWGIGRKRARALAELGISTVRDLARADEGMLSAAFGPSSGPWLKRIARGQSDDRVDPRPRQRRSLSHERTYQVDLRGRDEIVPALKVLAEELAADLRRSEIRTSQLILKIRFAPFETRSRSARLPESTNEVAELERAALEALAGVDEGRPVRLLGLTAVLPVRASSP
jgi:nucleotidyltransferase/DNA polymerase involved in DNA repair